MAAAAGKGTQPSSWGKGLAGAAGSSPRGFHTVEDSGLPPFGHMQRSHKTLLLPHFIGQSLTVADSRLS